MDEKYSVISTMLDDEPFDAAALVTALETREGRELLIDLVALRRLVQAPVAVPAAALIPVPPRRWRLLAAAVVVLAAMSGYVLGQRQTDRGAAAIATAPAPTRVVQSTATWQPIPPGGLQ